MRQTRFQLGRLLGDWRFLLAFGALFGLLWWETVGNMPNTFSYSAFRRVHSQANLDDMALSMGVDGEYDRVEELWEAFVDDPDTAQYYYLCTLCNLFFSPLMVNTLLAVWIIGYGIQGRSVSAMVLRGGSRLGAFLRLLLPYLLLALLLRWGVAFLSLSSFPIRWIYIPPDYLLQTIRLWLLMTASDVCLTGFVAFAVGSFAAVGLNLCRIPLLLMLGPARRVLPFAALSSKELWKPENTPASLVPAAAVAAVLLALSLLGSWLVFRKKELK